MRAVFAANEKRRNIFNGNGPKTKGNKRKGKENVAPVRSIEFVVACAKFI